MQSTFIDAITHLQLYFAKFLRYCVVIQADSKLIGEIALLTTIFPTFLFLIEYGTSSIKC